MAYAPATILENKTFACMAEAVAHYHKRGFVTSDASNGSRLMHHGTKEVWIRHNGKTAKEQFLNVKATVVNV